MKRNYYILLAMLLVWMTPLSMQAFGTTNKTIVAGCAGVTVVGGSGSIAIAGLGSYSHILVFTPGFASNVYDKEVNTATLNVPITTAGAYIVKVWSNPDPAAPCENNFDVTVTVGGGGGVSTLTLNGCANASATAATGATSAVVNYATPTATTTCAAGGATVTRTSGGASGTAFPVGASQVCFSATDACGNTQTCCITVTVTAGSPGGGGGTCTEYNVGNANDCAGGGWQPYGLYVGGYFQIKDGKFRKNSDGTATLTANYTTDGWNVVGSANVTFTGMTMTAPAGSPKYSTCTQGASTADWMYYTAFSGSVTLNGVTSTIARRGEAFQVGTGANWQNGGDLGASGWFTLGNGTQGDFNFRLSGATSCGGATDPCLTDATAPVISGCPSNIALTTTGNCANASWTAPTATDNCGTPTVTQLLGGANGSCFPVGTTMVKYMAKDAKGNFSTCIFNVVVTQTVVDPCANDVTAPVIANCPANIVKTPTAAGTCWTVSWTAPTATDNCGAATVTQTAGPSNGSCIAPGTYTVTYKATDAKGNASTCTFTVTVKAYLNCAVVGSNTIAKSCVNNVPSISGSALAGYEFVWLSSTTSCPTQANQTIAGANGQHYTLPSRVSTTTYFVRCARQIGCTTWGTINESNCVTVYASDCAPAVCNAPATPNGWMYLGVFGTSHYFKYTGSGDVTNADARAKCTSIGGRLPVIKTAAQNAFIQSKLGGGNCWIGIRRSGSNWVWDNNAVITYSNWGAGEPNNYGGNEHCAQLCGAGHWNDVNCASYNWCIAEIPCAGVNTYLAATDQISISATAEVSSTRLEWTNNTGFKNDFFTVEKQNQTTGDFEKLAIVNNKYFTDITEFYSVTDNAPEEGDNTYRVKVTYVDGTSKTSGAQTVSFKGSEGIRLFPNPAVDAVGVDLSKYKGQAVTVSLYNQFGQQVLTQQIEKASGIVTLDVSQNSAGNYLIRVVSKGRKDAIQQVHIAK
jgi:Lectin C-type domain/HYR domain/Secretion system C-terminal sorting domain